MHDCKTTFRGGRSSAQRPPSSYLPLGLISVGIIASWYVMDDVTWSSFVTLYSITLQYDAQLARRNSPRSREWRGGETIVAQQWRRRGKGWRGGGERARQSSRSIRGNRKLDFPTVPTTTDRTDPRLCVKCRDLQSLPYLGHVVHTHTHTRTYATIQITRVETYRSECSADEFPSPLFTRRERGTGEPARINDLSGIILGEMSDDSKQEC